MFNSYRATNVVLFVGLFGCCAMGGVQAQILHASEPLPSFEVATIKPFHRTPGPPVVPGDAPEPKRPAKIDPGGATGGLKTDHIHIILPMVELIASAYNLPHGSADRILRGPEWMYQDLDQYEIEAKIDASEFAAMQNMTAAEQRERVALMEQSLLMERFKLSLHFEKREMAAYALVATKNGAKLTPSKEGEANRLSLQEGEKGRELVANAVTLDQFVHSPLLRGGTAGRAVVDQTGLQGAYDFKLVWRPEMSASDNSDSPSFFTAMQEQLGLRMVSMKTQVEVIVVDQIERPSAN